MISEKEIREAVEREIKTFGLKVYDIDLPSVREGVFRVYVWKGKGEDPSKPIPVGIEDCLLVTRRLQDALIVEGIFRRDLTVEVSSPGVNRRLRDEEHFRDAVGEQIFIKVRTDKGARVIRGLLKDFRSQEQKILIVKESGKDKEKKEDKLEEFFLEDIIEARVDYPF
ncbi:MAG: hypothetical protein D6780_01870 [Candidatus Dadabacteria bacterium]|nr:MAG: hypothetical protein D6780_01870 [Candidatus Dadabacteria bacterium]